MSIVIPHYNRASLLQETLSSLQKQNLSEWEAIVVDDGSNEEEWKAAQRFTDHRVHFYRRTEGKAGPSRCRNIGWQLAMAPLIVFLDSDDLVAPWCLEKRLAVIRDMPHADACVFPVMLFRSHPGDINTLWNQLTGENDLERFLRSDPPWHTTSPIWRRGALQRIGGFDEEVMYGDDTDLHIRALLAGISFVKLPELLPDAFVRRNDTGRITNTMSNRLLDSRRTRLKRGSAVVQQFGSRENQVTWQGQYLVEADFLLFNVPDSDVRQRDILTDWQCTWSPKLFTRAVVIAYNAAARRSFTCCFLALRICRRFARILLPETFFPTGGEFESACLPVSEFQLLQVRLSTSEDAATLKPGSP